jgi:hypothetical protein
MLYTCTVHAETSRYHCHAHSTLIDLKHRLYFCYFNLELAASFAKTTAQQVHIALPQWHCLACVLRHMQQHCASQCTMITSHTLEWHAKSAWPSPCRMSLPDPASSNAVKVECAHAMHTCSITVEVHPFTNMLPAVHVTVLSAAAPATHARDLPQKCPQQCTTPRSAH